jgi:O-antigen/teichoic acid export membrane protein
LVLTQDVDEDSIDDLRQIGGGSTQKIIGAACNSVFSLLLIIIVTRGYPQQKAGTFFAATTLFLLIGQASEIGADEAMLRYIPAFRASGRACDLRRLIRMIAFPMLMVSAFSAIVALGFAPLLGRALGGGGDQTAMLTSLRTLLPFIPVIALGELVLAATRGFQRMAPSTLIYDIGLAALQMLLPLVALLAFKGSVEALVVAWVVPYVFVATSGLLVLRRMLRDRIKEPPTDEELVSGYWRFAIPRAAARLAQYGLRRIDVVLVASLSGVKDAAIYTAITRLITVGTVGVQAVQQVAQPKLGELFSLEERARKEGRSARYAHHRRALTVFQTSTVWLMAVSWPAFVLFAVFSPVLMHSFGHGYTSGGSALAILCISQMLTVATGPVDVALVQMGRSGLSLFNQSVALALDVVLCVVLIPKYGIVGAAIARIVALQWNNLAPAAQVLRRSHLHPISRASLTIGTAAVVCVGGVGLAIRTVHGANLESLGATLAIGAVAYITILVLVRRMTHLDLLVHTVLRRGR